ncbi:uncharacterized protein EI90DRAFT_1651661 [Cantharellus anzutake]|uniref:uncharacterized protein n=1 Tax=Cantharellus anzutake TaxID=1750568 RepID=UPI001907899F|nr:uncharacterized protein EI90DRAFT_1651661 [Cantharellus anzutake]KAF8327977.1 hypothetical protein EI90DRAFT_1651661 [Cantharellus anzutake]
MAPKRKPSWQYPALAPSSGDPRSSQPQPSNSSLPQIRFTRARTGQIHDNTSYDQLDGPHLQPPGVRSTPQSSSGSKGSERRISPGRPVTELLRRSPDPDLSSAPNLTKFVPTMPSHASPGGSRPSLSRPSFPGSIDNRHSTSTIQPIYDPRAILNAHEKYMDMDTDTSVLSPPSGETSSSSAIPAGGRKETAISVTISMLRSASSAFKISPVPYASQILDSLVTLLQGYETIDSNNKNLEGLHDEVRKAYITILRPLQLCTSQIPPEVIFLFKEFHSTLEGQVKRIESLKSLKRLVKFISATKIARDISDVKTCINTAIVSRRQRR